MLCARVDLKDGGATDIIFEGISLAETVLLRTVDPPTPACQRTTCRRRPPASHVFPTVGWRLGTPTAGAFKDDRGSVSTPAEDAESGRAVPRKPGMPTSKSACSSAVSMFHGSVGRSSFPSVGTGNTAGHWAMVPIRPKERPSRFGNPRR